MTDANTIVERYFAVWNETDPTRRRELIDETWSEDASYVDPLLAGEGRDGIDALVAGLQQQLPEHRFRLAGPVDSHHDRLRFAWELVGPNGDGPVFAGIDFGVIAPDGRLRAITGFLDRAPAEYLP